MRREQANSKNAKTKVTMGLLDVNGVWIPLKILLRSTLSQATNFKSDRITRAIPSLLEFFL